MREVTGQLLRSLPIQIVKELLSCGADPNLPLTRGLGTALCVVCDLAYEHQRSTDNKITLVRGTAGPMGLGAAGWTTHGACPT